MLLRVFRFGHDFFDLITSQIIVHCFSFKIGHHFITFNENYFRLNTQIMHWLDRSLWNQIHNYRSLVCLILLCRHCHTPESRSCINLDYFGLKAWCFCIWWKFMTGLASYFLNSSFGSKAWCLWVWPQSPHTLCIGAH